MVHVAVNPLTATDDVWYLEVWRDVNWVYGTFTRQDNAIGLWRPLVKTEYLRHISSVGYKGGHSQKVLNFNLW